MCSLNKVTYVIVYCYSSYCIANHWFFIRSRSKLVLTISCKCIDKELDTIVHNGIRLLCIYTTILTHVADSFALISVIATSIHIIDALEPFHLNNSETLVRYTLRGSLKYFTDFSKQRRADSYLTIKAVISDR